MKEAAEPPSPPQEPESDDAKARRLDDEQYERDQHRDTVQAADVMRRSGGNDFRGAEVIWLKPKKTYDDLVPLDTLQKRLVRDKPWNMFSAPPFAGSGSTRRESLSAAQHLESSRRALSEFPAQDSCG